ARDRRALRIRLGIRTARGRWLLPCGVPCRAGRTQRHLRSDRRFHAALSRLRGTRGHRSRCQSMTSSSSTDDRKALILWTITMSLLGLVLLYSLYLIRNVLLLLYVSGIFAIGFSPIVRWIERQRVLPIGTRLPRWLAILVLYLFILSGIAGICAAVFPPLVSQARDFWDHLPRLVEQGQAFLIE